MVVVPGRRRRCRRPWRPRLAGEHGRVEGREAGALRAAVAERLDRPDDRLARPSVDPGDVDDVRDLLPADRHRRAGERDGVDQLRVLIEDAEPTLDRPVLIVSGQRADGDPDLEVLAAALDQQGAGRRGGERADRLDLPLSTDSITGFSVPPSSTSNAEPALSTPPPEAR